MNTQYTLLIADRNPNVRSFLRREMEGEGYRVVLAKNAVEVVQWAFRQGPLDLVILDPDLPDSSEMIVLEHLKDRIPAVQLIIHTFPSDDASYEDFPNIAAFIEKRGNSIELLKGAVRRILSQQK